MESKEKLKRKMRERTPILLLGAGFSVGAINAKGEELPTGNRLAEVLFERMYSNYENYEKDDLENAKKYMSDLKKLCMLFRSEGRVEKRNSILEEIFKGCRPGEKNFHKILTKYPWEYIFSLNIDDLVENIYEEQDISINVWNAEKRGEIRNPLLVKLHGSVSNIKEGVIFDDEEYQSFTIEQNCLLKEFANQFTKNDVIILGTEFEEPDINTILKLYENSGYNNSGYDYFFVSPQINLILKNIINKHNNFHYIKMTTEEFLNYMQQTVSGPKEITSKLKQHGATFVNEYRDVKKPYKSSIYNGANSCYEDFFDDWDILYPGSEKILNEIIESDRHYVIPIVGKQYSGKTCVAKRFLVNFNNQGFEAFEVQRLDRSLITEIKEYLNLLAENSKVAIFIDNSAFQYGEIIKFIKEVPSKISQLVIISTDTLDNYHAKRYILEEYDNVKLLNIEEKLNKDFGKKIYEKLFEKHRLGLYLSLLPAKQELGNKHSEKIIVKKIKEINDLIDALYFSSNGQKFKDYYKQWLRETDSKVYYEYIIILCFLGKLGVTDIPVQLVAGLIPEKKNNFNMEEFKEIYKEIVIIEKGRLTIRRRRMIQDLMEFESSFVVAGICNLLLELEGLFTENERNIYYEIFQKISRVKKLKNLRIDTREVYKMLQDLENKYKEFSYFWIQYGIAAQILQKYESATNHLNYAKHLQPESFAVKHALAKNKMEIALYNLKHKNDSANADFELGEIQIIMLIHSPKHVNNYFYSVHTYIDLLLQYGDVTKTGLTEERYQRIYELLEKITKGKYDSYMRKLIDKYVEHCKKYKCNERFYKKFENYHTNKINKVTCEDDYETDLIES